MAVPFRAARTPSERSEFAQPDVALLLTTLAYYHDGLSRAEVLEALSVLLALGGSAREDRYQEWYCLSRDRMDAGRRHGGTLPEFLHQHHPGRIICTAMHIIRAHQGSG